MLGNCRGGLRPISLCVEKTKSYDQVLTLRPWRPKLGDIFYRPVFTRFEAP